MQKNILIHEAILMQYWLVTDKQNTGTQRISMLA